MYWAHICQHAAGLRRFTVLKQLINPFYHHWDDSHTAVAAFWLLYFLRLMYFRPSPNVSHSQLKRLLWIHTSFALEVAVATTVSTWAECFVLIATLLSPASRFYLIQTADSSLCISLATVMDHTDRGDGGQGCWPEWQRDRALMSYLVRDSSYHFWVVFVLKSNIS